MKKPVHFASVLFIAAALLWVWHQAPAADRVALLAPAASALR